MEAEALYLRDGSSYVGTILTQGGWDPNGANGGTVLALLGQCLDQVPTLVPMSVSRITADLVRPVPLGRRLEVTSAILREGKKIQVVQLLLSDVQADLELVRVTALRLRDADLRDQPVPPSTTDARPAEALLPPERSVSIREVSPHQPGFLRAVDLRRTRSEDGSVRGSWLKLDVPVVAGEPTTPNAHLACAIDYANLVGLDGPTLEMTMINPDVTAHLLRPPAGEWIAVTGDTRFEPARGRGVSLAQLSDADGVFGVASTSQLVQPR
jgi:hypothetical protein